MKFQSMNRRYIVKSRDVTRDNYGRKIGDIKGMSCKFEGKTFPYIFDSEQTARANRWTDEERLEVERFLLSDPEFGMLRTVDGGGTLDRQLGNLNIYELYLASGETIPAEHAEFVKDLRWFQTDQPQVEAPPESTELCMWSGPDPEDPDELIACTRKAIQGKAYCQNHVKVPA